MQPSRSLFVLLFVTACVGELPPPPKLSVTSPTRGLVQGDASAVMVMGVAQPGSDGARVTRVTVNDTPAQLAADGSFTASLSVAQGVTLIETKAFSEEGATAIDARAVHVGQLRPVGTSIDRAIGATLSTEAFARISTAASEILKTTDLSALLAPQSLGDSLANLKLTINKLSIADVKIGLTPVDGGLALDVEISGLAFGAKAAYGGTLVPDGSTNVSATADKIHVTGTLVATPNGTGGFKTTISSPNVSTTALKLSASGLVGSILDLLQSHLSSVVSSVTTSSAELALGPLLNKGLGALAGPKSIGVLGKMVTLQASPADIAFTRTGAMAMLNLQAKIGGGETSRGYIYQAHAMPKLDVGNGVQVALSDNLLNDLLAQVHALGILDLHLNEDFGLFDTIDIHATLPPMISANTSDGTVRLVLGDMIASVANDGKTIVRAAINAQVDVAIDRGNSANEIAIRLGKVHVFANLLDDPEDPSMISAEDLAGAADAGVGLQLESLDKFLVTVPVPAVAGVSLDNLSLRGDSGYAVAAGQIH